MFKSHQLVDGHLEDRLKAIVDLSAVVVWRAGPDGTPSQSCKWDETLGTESDEHHAESWIRHLHEDDQEKVRELWRSALQDTTTFEAVYRVRQPDNGFRWAHGRGIPLKDPDGTVREWVGTVSDIHDRVIAETALAESEERLWLALDSAEFGIWDYNIADGEIWASGRGAELLGTATAPAPADCTIAEQQLLSLVHPDDVPKLRQTYEMALLARTGRRIEHEFRIVRQDTGEVRWLASSARMVTGPDERPARIIGTLRDVTGRREQQDRLYEWAHYDPLTGLANRRLLVERARDISRDPCGAAVLMIDIDGFSDVNDTLGHTAGDALLVVVAERLRMIAPAGATIARVGGDEFVLLVPGLADAAAANALARGILAALAPPVLIADRSIVPTASIGIAMSTDTGWDQELLIGADLALCKAQASGASLIRFYSPRLREEARQRQELHIELNRAFEQNEFELHYQPRVRLADDCVVGMEALLRWRHPSRGLLMPGTFLPVLDKSALAADVGDWVLRQACADAAALAEVAGDLVVSVNLFALQFSRGRLDAAIRDALGASGLPAERLEIEITETIMLSNDDTALAELHRIRGLGVAVAFDDYGTGYASLGMLKHYPVTRLKIDNGFVRHLVTTHHGSADPSTGPNPAEQDGAIIEAILSLARSFGLGVTAEGIETPDQLAFLRQRDCEEGQGFLFGAAVPIAEFAQRFLQGPRPTSGLQSDLSPIR